MFGLSNREKLVKKRLACSKTRRKPTQKEWMRRLESDARVKAGIFGFFVLVLALLIFSGEHPDWAVDFRYRGCATVDQPSGHIQTEFPCRPRIRSDSVSPLCSEIGHGDFHPGPK